MTNNQQTTEEKLRKALERQTDNMSFLLNRVTIPDEWYEKLCDELNEDRELLL